MPEGRGPYLLVRAPLRGARPRAAHGWRALRHDGRSAGLLASWKLPLTPRGRRRPAQSQMRNAGRSSSHEQPALGQRSGWVSSAKRWTAPSGQAGLKISQRKRLAPAGAAVPKAPGRVGGRAGARRAGRPPAEFQPFARERSASGGARASLNSVTASWSCLHSNRTRSARRGKPRSAPPETLGAVSAFRALEDISAAHGWLLNDCVRASLRSAGGRPPPFCRRPSESAPCVPRSLPVSS